MPLTFVARNLDGIPIEMQGVLPNALAGKLLAESLSTESLALARSPFGAVRRPLFAHRRRGRVRILRGRLAHGWQRGDSSTRYGFATSLSGPRSATSPEMDAEQATDDIES